MRWEVVIQVVSVSSRIIAWRWEQNIVLLTKPIEKLRSKPSTPFQALSKSIDKWTSHLDIVWVLGQESLLPW